MPQFMSSYLAGAPQASSQRTSRRPWCCSRPEGRSGDTGVWCSCLARWRVPADADPATARIHDDLVIGVEGDNGGPTNRGQPEKTDAGRLPGKVVSPCLLTGVKEGHQFARQRIGYP